MIHLEPGHRIVAETVAARIHSTPDKREAVDVRCSDFGSQYYVSALPEEKQMLRVSLWVANFQQIKDLVGESFFSKQYSEEGTCLESPQQGYSLTVAVNLDEIPQDTEKKDALVRKLASIKRDVVGAPLWVCFTALLNGGNPPRPYYVVETRPDEAMYVIPSKDLVVVVYSLSFENQVEQAIAKVFVQVRCIARQPTCPAMLFLDVEHSH